MFIYPVTHSFPMTQMEHRTQNDNRITINYTVDFYANSCVYKYNCPAVFDTHKFPINAYKSAV